MSDELKLKLVFDSSDAEKAAQALPDAVDRANRKKKSWERQDAPSGSASDYRKMAGMGEEAARQEAARKERERKQEEADYKKRLKWNSKILEDQQKAAENQSKAAEKQSNASEWADEFGKRLGMSMLGAVTPIAAIFSLFKAGFEILKDQARVTDQVRGTQERSGMGARDVRMARILASNLTENLSADEGQRMAEQAYGKMREFAIGMSTEGQRGFSAFGFDQEKFLKGEQTYVDLLANMSDAYEKYGQSAKFAAEAESIFGKEWTALRPILASGRRVITTDPLGASITPSDMMNPNAMNTVNIQRMAHGLPPIKSMMGGNAAGSIPQMLSGVTSLQAMGGGDVMSAIARGPQDKIEDNTARTAAAVEKMANGDAKQTKTVPVLK